MTLLFHSKPERYPAWRRVFDTAGEPLLLGADSVSDPDEVTHLVCWVPPTDLRDYPNLRMVISLGAGVDHLSALPPGIALARTLAPGIDAMVRDWTVMATLMLHRDMPSYLADARSGLWTPREVPLARQRRVGVMGMGRIGRLAAQSLVALGFDVAGWSRSGAAVPGIKMFGAAGLDGFLTCSDILVCLLPLTDDTRGILTADLFDRLPRGARLVHAGRGAHLDMAALGAALDRGQLTSAMLDVTDPEPLPVDHPAWSDPRILITPHVAAYTDAEEGARHALAILQAERNGQPIPGLVDQSRGY